jgi:GPH family glycoside/pentoside/hexuronide:cation symporter
VILPRYALYSAMLAAAGLPIYIHAPKFFVDEYGVGLGAIGAVLFGLRLVDVVQDPLLGRLAGRLGPGRGPAAAVGAAGLGLGMIGLFAVEAPVAPLVWMGLCLTLLFTSFSFLTILFYARGVAQAEEMGKGGHVRLAGWRETGALIGVSLASIAPFLLLGAGAGAPYAAFALIFAALAGLAAWAMRPVWAGRLGEMATGFGALLRDGEVRSLLAIGLLNAAPVAVTSTLFLFFVEYRLGDADMAGPFLLLFFVAAALAAPVWSMAARKWGARRMLALGMGLSIAAFAWAWTLGTGDEAAFVVICLASGAALGADMTLLPALFARRIAEIDGNGAEAFGLWSFCAKFTLAAAAGVMLPLLEAGGFRAGEENGPAALARLSLLYALVPCGLKLIALGLLTFVRPREPVTC